MRLPALRSPLAPLVSLALGLLTLLAASAPLAKAYNPVLEAPAMYVDDGLAWGAGKDVDGHRLQLGDKITTTLRVGNGIPGQDGYRTSSPAPVAGRKPTMLTGPTRTLDYPARKGGAVRVRLPFPFPFGGLRERSASVSSDGRISFGSPAWDSWEQAAGDDRSAAVVVGDFERGIMPYWGNLEVSDHGAGGPAVRMVTPAGGKSVAFQWEAAPAGGGPRRDVQLVLFRDGRFRFDYPGRNSPGGAKAFVGYSLGTGPAGFHPIATDTRSVPAGSVLVSPRPVDGAKTLPAGRALLDLPPAVVPNLPHECRPLSIPGQPESTICFIPALKPGAEAVRTVSFRAPGATGVARKGVSIPNPLAYSGAYAAGPRVLGSDDDEVSPVGHSHEPNWLSLMPFYSGSAPPVVGEWAEFGIAASPHVGEVENATVTVTAPANVANFQVSAYGTNCSRQNAEGAVSCTFTNAGLEYLSVTVRMRPMEAAVGSPLQLPVSVTSPEFKSVSATVSSPPVLAAP